MKTLRLLSPMQNAGMAVVAAVATVSILGAVLLAFADDGATPWFGVDTQVAALLAHCEAIDETAARHTCLREVAVAAAAPSRNGTALAHR